MGHTDPARSGAHIRCGGCTRPRFWLVVGEPFRFHSQISRANTASLAVQQTQTDLRCLYIYIDVTARVDGPTCTVGGPRCSTGIPKEGGGGGVTHMRYEGVYQQRDLMLQLV